MKTKKNEIDLFDEFKIKPMTEGLGFNESPTKKSKIPEKKKKYDKASGGVLFNSTQSKKIDSIRSSNDTQFFNKKENLDQISPNSHLHETHQSHLEKENQPATTRSLEDQLKEMNQIMEQLSASYHSLKKLNQNSKKEEEILSLDLEDLENKEKVLDRTKKEKEEAEEAEEAEQMINLSFEKKENKKINTSLPYSFSKKYKKSLNSSQRKTPISSPQSSQQEEEEKSRYAQQLKAFDKNEVTHQQQLSSMIGRKKPSLQLEHLEKKPNFIKKPPVKPTQKLARKKDHLESDHWISTHSPHLGALLIDCILTLSLSIIFLIAPLSILKIDFLNLAYESQKDIVFYLSISFLYLSLLFLYLITLRGFFGKTPGEWLFKFRLGSQFQRQNAFYPLLLMWRMFLISGTGFIFFPALSLLLRKNILFYLTGLRIYKKTSTSN